MAYSLITDAAHNGQAASMHALMDGLQVLVIEDDEADAYLIELALCDHPRVGEIVHAADGAEALTLIDNGTVEPDLAIVDLHMPRKDGFSFLVELGCRDEPRFPSVVLTSSTARSDAVRSLLRGANQVLTKPPTVDELEAILGSAIASV